MLYLNIAIHTSIYIIEFVLFGVWNLEFGLFVDGKCVTAEFEKLYYFSVHY
jgi:hypothetical protein